MLKTLRRASSKGEADKRGAATPSGFVVRLIADAIDAMGETAAFRSIRPVVDTQVFPKPAL